MDNFDDPALSAQFVFRSMGWAVPLDGDPRVQFEGIPYQ
jgi:hypothetical protein